MKIWERDEEAKVWRLVILSRIQNNTLRRLALVTTLPLMFAWWAVGVAWLAVLLAVVAVIGPFYQAYRTFPIELFRSFVRRWNEPLEPRP